LYIPTPYQDAVESGRLILRDGSTASVRVAGRDDRQALLAFFEKLSPESRYRRFFSVALPRPELLETLCDSSEPGKALTLVVLRTIDGAPRVVAAGSYHLVRERTAELAFAVDDAFHGKGLATLLLERLTLLATRHGIERFWAVTHADNQKMIEVFRDSGFEVREKLEGGFLEIDLPVAPTQSSVSRSELRDRVATATSLRPFFQPRAVAVVGASRDPTSIGYRILDGLLHNGFRGPLYPINPKAADIRGVKAYPSVRDLPEPVDLAVIAVPRDLVLPVVDDCATRGVRALVVITAGFSEGGAGGRDLQRQLVERVRGHGMRLVGPNCLGLLNTDPAVRLNASFSPVFPPPGKIAMSTQSGALGLAILAAAERFRLGLSTFVSIGNKADVSGNDLLLYWEEDPGTDVILLYMESFGNPRRFSQIVRRVGLKKPVVAVKAGRTQAGSRAAGSHTAALAASDVAVDALFHQSGVIRADTLEEMFDLAAALGSQPLPAGRRVGIVTNAGGPAILCADTCEAGGLTVPELSDSLKARLGEFLPAAASRGNPVDMIASAPPEHYRRTIEALLVSDEVDALIVIYIPVGLAETSAVIDAVRQGVTAARSAPSSPKQPVLACLMAEAGVRTQLDFGSEQVPSFVFPEAAARVLSKTAAYADWRRQPPGIIPDFEDMDFATIRQICAQAAARGPGWLSVDEARKLLEEAKLPVAAGGVARTADEAAALARQAGFPVAVKLASQRLVHKTEVGGVHLNLADEEAVRRAFQAIRDRLAKTNQLEAMEGVLVQPMVAGGLEVMVGVTDDPQFGPLIAFGLGGVYVEILADVSFRMAPLTDRDAHEMVRSIRGRRLLEGYRGRPAADVEAIEEVLLRISRLVEEVPAIGELDLNPVFALPPGQGCRIVDARIKVKPVD
jgi:acetyl coenzyme A synthetase (ADP forming)-like protein